MISVLIPALNEEPFIATTILSLLQQTDLDEPVEIIVLDGGSTDETVREAEAALGDNDNGKVVCNPGRTVSEASRIGLAISSGDKIVIAGAHAEYPQNFLSVLANELNDPTVGAA